MFLLPRRFPLSLLLALLLYLGLALGTVRQVGFVGEVDLSWGLGRPPAAVVALDPQATWADGAAQVTSGHRWGPLVASQVRPVEGLLLGELALPLAVNAYTGGPPDWPARLVWLATGEHRAVVALHVLLGAVLLVLVHRFLRFRGSDVAAAIAVLLLASDWSFLFYRKVLGGTELLLQAAGLLCLWALWSRRWGGGRHGLWALGLGIGLGLVAKITFLLTLAALLLAALLMRWDRPAMKAPAIEGVGRGLLAIVLLTSPLWVTALHHGLAVPEHLASHDFPSLQWRRVLAALSGSGATAPPREGLVNLWLWLSEPLAFFGPAYGVAQLPGPSPWRLAGWALVVAGVALGWRDRDPSPTCALLRFSSLYLVLQVGLLWLVARDLHHLAQAAPTAAITAGLALDRLAGVATPPRSLPRAHMALALALPWILAGGLSLRATDRVVQQVPAPTFSEQGQAELVALLRRHRVQRLVLADYETYGMLELRAPELETVHLWPLVARRGPQTLGEVLAFASERQAHFLLVQASQPMGYNLRQSPAQVQREAAERGLLLRELGRLQGDRAVLFAVDD